MLLHDCSGMTCCVSTTGTQRTLVIAVHSLPLHLTCQIVS